MKGRRKKPVRNMRPTNKKPHGLDGAASEQNKIEEANKAN